VKESKAFLQGMILMFVVLLAIGIIERFSSLPLPRHLTINGESWTVTPTAIIGDGLLGETHCETRSIDIRQGMSPADNAENLLH